MKRLTARISAAALAVTACAGAGAAALPASPASALVLINEPGTSVKVGHTFTVGDWFQEYSGGSRWFTTNVDSPSGARVFHETGYAPSSRWDFWNIRATRTGTYKVMYEFRRHGGRDGFIWYTVRAHR
jgi:hypothetical protein